MITEVDQPPASYYLFEPYMNGQKFPIDESQHAMIDNAITTVVSVMEVEELFQVFAQSYVRFEKDLLDIILDFAYLNMGDLVENDAFRSNARHRFNINIITVLTAFRSYDDHSDRIFSKIKNSTAVRGFNKKSSNQVFDTHFSYRVCSQLRNYAQHHALPLSGFSIGAHSDYKRDDTQLDSRVGLGFHVSPWLDVPKFKSFKKLKKSIRDELDDLGYEKIDMKWLIRSLAKAMYKRHSALREYLTPIIEAAGRQISTGYDLAKSAKGSEVEHLDLHGGGNARPMTKDLTERLLREFKTYKSLRCADEIYATSQIKPEATSYSGQALIKLQ